MKKNNSPAFTAAGVAPAVTLSPFACAAAKLSVPDIADCWGTKDMTRKLRTHSFPHEGGWRGARSL